jgi:putative DNA primase/helicase
MSEYEELIEWSLKSQSVARLQAMLDIAEFQQPIACLPGDFDRDPWLLNCLSGTINLKTGRLQPHNPEDMITKLCPVDYEPDAKFKMWDDFLDTATAGDESIKQFLQTAIGYSLTGDVSEEKLFFIHGDSATGKSTFLEAIKATLGDHAMTADFETFLQRKQVGQIRNDIARLCGARFVISIEVDEGKKLAEGLVKTLTGGDTVSARFLYKEAFEFVPQFKLFLAANHAPRIKDDDAAIWRRIIRIPFEHGIPEDQQDPKIKATLRNPKIAGPAILAWAVKGCLCWQQKGLVIPDVIKQSIQEYRESQDPLLDFFEDECEFALNAFVPVAELRVAYDQHCKDNGVRYPLGPKHFNQRLRGKNCETSTKRYNNEVGTETVGKCWSGVTLKSKPRYVKGKNQQEIQEEIPF